MTPRCSHTYEELERVADGYNPKHHLTLFIVVNDGDNVSSESGVLVLTELATLLHGAEAFKVTITNVYDEVENSALVSLSGPAGYIGDLAAFMASTKAPSAR